MVLHNQIKKEPIIIAVSPSRDVEVESSFPDWFPIQKVGAKRERDRLNKRIAVLIAELESINMEIESIQNQGRKEQSDP